MMGDNVNLAARMESAAKQWGVYTMVADATRQAAEKHGDRVVFRPLGKLQVVGRQQAVPVHEIVDVLANASGLLVVAGLALQFANRGLATIPLRIITANQGIDLGRGTLFRILLAVQFYALVLPGALAGGGATWLKYLQFGAGKGAAAASVIINRGVGLLVLVPISSLALAADPRVGPLPPLAASSLIVANLIGLYLFWSPYLPRARCDAKGH